jgi:hypothetical protein
MPTKNNKKKVFGRTEIYKHKLEKSRDKEQEYSSYIPIFLGVGLAVMLLFIGIGVASAAPTAVIHVGSQQQVGYTVCIDGSQSTGRNPMGTDGDIFGIRTYTWNFGDGSPEVSGEYFGMITHVYNSAGTYNVMLKVVDHSGQSATTSTSITVGTLPKVTVGDKSTSAIKSAISSLNGKPGIVYLPAGSYPITSTITIPANTIIEGAGMTKTQLYGGGTIFSIGGNNVRITGLEIEGRDQYGGITCNNKNNFYIDHCDMHGFKCASQITRYSSAMYEHNYIHDNSVSTGYGIEVTTNAYLMVRYNELYNNRHSIAAGGRGAEPGWNTGYDCIFNHIYEKSYTGSRDVPLDAHSGTHGRVRISDNVFENMPYAIGLRDCWGEIRRNTFRNIWGYICKLDEPIRGATGEWVPGGGIYNFHIDHNTITSCGTHWRILYAAGDVYLNCRKINYLIPFEGEATWDDCVAAYGTISGTVTDKDIGLGIQGATVTANGYSDPDGTNINGDYIIPDVPVGTSYTVTVSATNYQSQSQANVEVLEDQTTTVNFQLTEAPALVGLWRFDEGEGATAHDSSVYGNDGTLMPNYPSNAPTWVDPKGISLDGIDDYIDCGNNPVLDITGPVTIIVSIKPNVAGEGGPNACPISKAESGVDWSWQLRYNAPDGYMGFLFNGNPEGSTWVSVKQNLQPETRYHIGGVFDGTSIICYLNGLQTDINQISAIKGGNAPLFIGQDGWNNVFNGIIYEVRIYNRALSSEEIKADYEAVVNNSMYPSYDVNEDGKVDILDTAIVGQHFGETTNSPYPSYDVNEDGKVDILDTTIVGQHFGEITS